MEKAYRAFGSELSHEVTPLEAGMARFVDLDKGDFVGRTALLARQEKPLQWKLAYLSIEAKDRDVIGAEPVYHKEKLVGSVTSGGFGHFVGKNLAFAYVEPPYAELNTELEVTMLGQAVKAKVLKAPAYDPTNQRLKA